MVRPRLEAALSLLFAVAAAVTLVRPTWIEAVTRLEPDGGSGATEWWLVLALGAVAVVVGVLARRDFRAARASGTGA